MFNSRENEIGLGWKLNPRSNYYKITEPISPECLWETFFQKIYSEFDEKKMRIGVV